MASKCNCWVSTNDVIQSLESLKHRKCRSGAVDLRQLIIEEVIHLLLFRVFEL